MGRRVTAATKTTQVSGLKLEMLAGPETPAGEWPRLAVLSKNIFATPEWLAAWCRQYEPGDPIIAGFRDSDGGLRAIVPLHRSRIGPVRSLRFLGHGPSDELGPICDGADRRQVAQALAGALRGSAFGAWDVLVGEHLRADDAWVALLGATMLRRERSPVVAGGRTFDEFLAARSSNFRQQVRRRERKLIKDHSLDYRLAADPERLQEDLSTLFRLHSARWSAGESTAFSPDREAFHRDFAPIALERGWLRLWLAEVDGRAVAALYGFRYAGNELYYQSGRDPAWDRDAVGFVLLAHSIRAALDEGVGEYRMLRGDEAYKDRFADGDPGLETAVVGHGRTGRGLAHLVGPLAQRPRARALLRRLAS